MVDDDRWLRLLLSLLAELEADGHPQPERAAVDEYMHIRRELWRAHMRRRGRHLVSICPICIDLRDTWEKP